MQVQLPHASRMNLKCAYSNHEPIHHFKYQSTTIPNELISCMQLRSWKTLQHSTIPTKLDEKNGNWTDFSLMVFSLTCTEVQRTFCIYGFKLFLIEHL